MFARKARAYPNGAPVLNATKLFTSVIYDFSKQASVFVFGKPFQLCFQM
jgi:hypothetical protein